MTSKQRTAQWPEWRATGRQSVISGEHPSGNIYCVNGRKPIQTTLDKIPWPEDVELPWTKPEQEAQPPPPPHDIDAELTAKCGPPFAIGKRGALVINQSYFVQRISFENLIFFEYVEKRFFRYNPDNGAWEDVPAGVIKEVARAEWERYTKLFQEPRLALKNDDTFLNALTSGIQAHSGRSNVFRRLEKIIHCANGMLHIEADGSWKLMPFSPAYFARNPTHIAWDPTAVCPDFEAALQFALPADDVDLFWRWFGSVLLTGNAAHRILLLVGEAATAKSTITELVELVLGRHNCTALRTQLLDGRFEIGQLFGFSLLTAKDVQGAFLEREAAQVLKRLVGHDYTPEEVKGGMKRIPVYGDFDAVITCNERLLVRLEGETDIKAWRRRLMIFEFLNPIPPEKRVANYAQILFAKEAGGILRKAVEGAIAHLAELEECSNFRETDEQKARVNCLLQESESIKYFVTERVECVPGGIGVSTEELVSAYTDYCCNRGWRAFGIKQAERKLPDLMLSIHGVHVGTNITRNGKRVRGYPNVALRQTP